MVEKSTKETFELFVNGLYLGIAFIPTRVRLQNGTKSRSEGEGREKKQKS